MCHSSWTMEITFRQNGSIAWKINIFQGRLDQYYDPLLPFFCLTSLRPWWSLMSHRKRISSCRRGKQVSISKDIQTASLTFWFWQRGDPHSTVYGIACEFAALQSNTSGSVSITAVIFCCLSHKIQLDDALCGRESWCHFEIRYHIGVPLHEQQVQVFV